MKVGNQLGKVWPLIWTNILALLLSLSPSPWSWLYLQKLSSGEVGCSSCADTLVARETSLKLWANGSAGLCSAAEKQQRQPVLAESAHAAALITIHGHIFSKVSVSLNISHASAWEDCTVAEFANINKSHGYQNEEKLSEQTRLPNGKFPPKTAES